MRRSAGLPLSVGSAPLRIRVLVAAVLLVAGAICTTGGILISSHPGGRLVAVLLVIPLGMVTLVGAAFVLAPWSRFGCWLDHFLPRLGEPAVAVATAMLLWIGAFLLTWIRIAEPR